MAKSQIESKVNGNRALHKEPSQIETILLLGLLVIFVDVRLVDLPKVVLPKNLRLRLKNHHRKMRSHCSQCSRDRTQMCSYQSVSHRRNIEECRENQEWCSKHTHHSHQYVHHMYPYRIDTIVNQSRD